MDYDIDQDHADANPKHCTAVLHEKKNRLENMINGLVQSFVNETDLTLIGISFTSTPDCFGKEKFTGIKLQFDL